MGFFDAFRKKKGADNDAQASPAQMPAAQTPATQVPAAQTLTEQVPVEQAPIERAANEAMKQKYYTIYYAPYGIPILGFVENASSRWG